MPTPTRASEALRVAVDPDSPNRKTTQTKLARELGVTQPAVYFWMRGETRPTPKLRREIQRILRIPASDWLTDEEREEERRWARLEPRLRRRARRRKARKTAPPTKEKKRKAA